MALVNMMQKIVETKMDKLLAETDCCKCEVCRNDMLAYALNHLPPKYVNTSTGELYARVDALMQQNNIDVDVAISHAVGLVSNGPRHMNT